MPNIQALAWYWDIRARRRGQNPATRSVAVIYNRLAMRVGSPEPFLPRVAVKEASSLALLARLKARVWSGKIQYALCGLRSAKDSEI